MGCSTFSNFTVLPEIAVAKIREDAPFNTSCYIGCGVTTGVGAVVKTAKVEPGANVVVFGLGGIGLNVIQGAKLVGANRVVGIDINPDREEWGRKFGMVPSHSRPAVTCAPWQPTSVKKDDRKALRCGPAPSEIIFPNSKSSIDRKTAPSSPVSTSQICVHTMLPRFAVIIARPQTKLERSRAIVSTATRSRWNSWWVVGPPSVAFTSVP